jgi:integrase
MAGRVRHLQLWKGNYRVRIGMPAECRPHLPAPHTGKAELVKGLGTANLTIATKLAAPIVAIFQMMIEQARQQAAPMVWLHYDRPPQPWQPFAAQIGRRLVPEHVAAMFTDHPPTESELAAILDNKPIVPATDTAPLSQDATPLASLSFAVIIELWASEVRAPRPRKQKALLIFSNLEKHVEHNEAGRVSSADLVGFKESMVEAIENEELQPRTVEDRVRLLKTVFKWAAKNSKITTNPAVGLSYTARVDPRDERQDFTAEDMRILLTECRNSANPVIRISNLIGAYHGPRLAEIVEANVNDFRWHGKHLVFDISLQNREKSMTLKNHTSTPRRFPLHSAIRNEVAEYLATLPPGSPLFPNVKLDRDGKRGHNAGNTLWKWLRKIGVVTKGSKKCFHSHRHTYETHCRGLIDKDIRNYLMGHGAADVSAEYGKYPIARLAREIEKVNPLADPEAYGTDDPETTPLAA